MAISVPIERGRATPLNGTTVGRFFALDLLDNRFPALHGLRVLAIVSVIAIHITWLMVEQGMRLDPRFYQQSITVFFGMDLFFVLSGFLIGSILLRSASQPDGHHLRRFYLRRIFRTFPSYYFVLTLLAVAFPMTAHQRHHLPFEYIYGTNFLPIERSECVMFWGWSLGLEEQFYLVVPLLFLVLRRLRDDRARIALLAALMASALLIRLAIFYSHRPWRDVDLYGALYFRTHTRFDTLVAGILLAVIHRSYGKTIARWLQEPFHRALLALPSLACLWLLLTPEMFGPDTVQQVHVFAWGTITSLMYLASMPMTLYGEGMVCRGLAAPVFRRIATVGYGVYLVHIPVIDHITVPVARSAQDRNWSMLFVWPMAVAATMVLSGVIAYLLHVIIEKPALRLRDRFAA
jgi:peptidoglycan/LPS O-acetylase OafA/YrhL